MRAGPPNEYTNIIVIRDYRGYVSVATTNRCIATDLTMKSQSLDVFWKRSGLANTKSRLGQPGKTCSASSNPSDCHPSSPRYYHKLRGVPFPRITASRAHYSR